METNNIILTKKEFQTYIFENMGKFENWSGQKDTSVEETLTGALAFTLAGAVFIIMGFLGLIYQWVTFWVLLFIFFPLIHVSIGIWSILQVRVYRSLERYFNIKEFILDKDIFLKNIIEIDNEDLTINPSIVMAFVDILSEINNAYKHILTPLSVANEWRIYFKEGAQQKLNEFVGRERSWLLQYTISFRILLDSWLMNHQKELEQVQQNIEQFSHETQEWVDVLRMASTRLDMNIQNLEQVRVKI